MLSYHIMTEPEKRQVCAWQYDGEYAAYNLPDYTEMQKRLYRLRMGICRQFVTNFSISFRNFSMGNVKRFSFLRLQTISKSSIINHKGGE